MITTTFGTPSRTKNISGIIFLLQICSKLLYILKYYIWTFVLLLCALWVSCIMGVMWLLPRLPCVGCYPMLSILVPVTTLASSSQWELSTSPFSLYVIIGWNTAEISNVEFSEYGKTKNDMENGRSKLCNTYKRGVFLKHWWLTLIVCNFSSDNPISTILWFSESLERDLSNDVF